MSKILIADDDEAIREALAKLLLGEGYQLISATSGAEALEVFQRENGRIDLLLIDLNMPLKNGWATLDRIFEINPALPVIIITGQSNQQDLAESSGACGLVEKPIDVPAMLRLIRDVLARLVVSFFTTNTPVRHPFHHLKAVTSYPHPQFEDLHVIPYYHGGLNE